MLTWFRRLRRRWLRGRVIIRTTSGNKIVFHIPPNSTVPDYVKVMNSWPKVSGNIILFYDKKSGKFVQVMSNYIDTIETIY